MAHPGRIVSITAAMEWVGADESRRERVERALDWATAVIERETGTAWVAREEARVYDAPPPRGADEGQLLDLGSHIASVVEVKVGGVAVTDYVLLGNRGTLFRVAGWISGLGLRNVEVVAVFGVSQAGEGEASEGLPADITQACLDLVEWRLRGGAGAGSDVQQESIGDYSYMRRGGVSPEMGGIPPEIVQTLLSRRRW